MDEFIGNLLSVKTACAGKPTAFNPGNKPELACGTGCIRWEVIQLAQVFDAMVMEANAEANGMPPSSSAHELAQRDPSDAIVIMWDVYQVQKRMFGRGLVMWGFFVCGMLHVEFSSLLWFDMQSFWGTSFARKL